MKLHSTIIGEGKPFLILHGFLGMSDNWKTLGNSFAEEGYEVHLIDQRNHGKSQHSDDFNYNLLAEDVAGYCQDKQLENIILLGHSMGGKTAMLTAFLNPELVKKLLVVDIAPKYYAPHHQEILAGLTALDEATITSRGYAEDFLADFVPDKPTRLFLLKNLYWKTKKELSLKLNLEALKDNIEDLGAALPVQYTYDKPTLFIKGGNSRYIKEEDWEPIKEQFSKAELVTIPRAGHWVHAEKRKEFYTVVMSFL
ncbi:alpha/beta fold hydrolase [Salegentibacter sp. F188]|uniref:Alpha/beta fold hydrolase n=1 Tax=Autumnicola patrickiae TaxID=3075591 RepID=A0ABU3E007_9FLAO|nr:alpha/beta fold hydrolase [Salegentibacter sp. F188]MDT0689329.1 alpha/beta fold hydrolase [Salegentibacter sp. F188]